MEINWYPGHMARAKRLLGDQMSRVDVVIELCDARLPRSSRNPDLIRLTEKKERVLLLGKSDLADPALTRRWLSLLRREGCRCQALDMNRQAKAALALVEEAARKSAQEKAEKAASKKISIKKKR